MEGTTPVARPFLVLVIVLSATFVQLVDISIVNVAIPSIQEDLHATFSSVQLVIAVYQLAFACTLITAARLGDIYGRKRLFLLGMSGFTIASIICGAAQTPTQLVVARALQGFMSGLMFPQVLSVIQVIFPPAQRGKAFGIFGATIGLATILGPLLGGSLIALNVFGFQWRTIFYVNVPIGVGAVLAALRMLPESKAPDAPKLDLAGTALVASGLFLLVYPLSVGREKGWPAWTFEMLAASVPLLVGFVVLQLRKTRQNRSPLLIMSLFQDQAFRAGGLMSVVFFMGVAPFFFTFSIFLQKGFGYSALGAGLTTFPFALGSAFAASMSDRLTQRIGKRILSLGTGILTLGMALLIVVIHAVGTDLHSWQLAPMLLLNGLGLGCFVGPVTNVILAGVRREAAGSASGVLSAAQLVAGAIGLAILGAIFFGLIGRNADTSSSAVVPRLTSDLAAAGMPAAAVTPAVAHFRECFSRIAHSTDPSVVPPDCRADPAAPAAISARFTAASIEAKKRAFSRSTQEAILWEIAVFGLAFYLVSRLPSPPALDHGHDAAAAAAA